MKPVKKQVIDVSEDYRKSTIAYFNHYRNWLLCIDNLKDPYNRGSPYRTSFVAPGSIEERIYFKLWKELWKTNQKGSTVKTLDTNSNS